MKTTIYKDKPFDASVGVKVYERSKKKYRKFKLRLSDIARDAWEAALVRAERERGRGTQA